METREAFYDKLKVCTQKKEKNIIVHLFIVHDK